MIDILRAIALIISLGLVLTAVLTPDPMIECSHLLWAILLQLVTPKAPK